MRITRIPRNIPIRLRRIRDWKKNSFPFISGDLFADFADVSLFEPRFRRKAPSLNEISEAKIIFCPSHKYEEMLTRYGHLITARVLILGNSDRDFIGPLANLPPSVTKVFRQNSNHFDSIHQFLPIGIENLRWGENGQKGLFSREILERQKEQKILVGPFRPTHVERDFLITLKAGRQNSHHVLKGLIPPRKYAEISAGFTFISAPRGNGFDTHRFWESLYRGSYPVVLRSPWSMQIEQLGIPIIQIDKWSVEEMDRVVQLNRPLIDPRNIEQLWATYWLKKIDSFI